MKPDLVLVICKLLRQSDTLFIQIKIYIIYWKTINNNSIDKKNKSEFILIIGYVYHIKSTSFIKWKVQMKILIAGIK